MSEKECDSLMDLHDALLYLEGASRLFATGDDFTETENAFLMIADYVNRLRIDLFVLIEEGRQNPARGDGKAEKNEAGELPVSGFRKRRR